MNASILSAVHARRCVVHFFRIVAMDLDYVPADGVGAFVLRDVFYVRTEFALNVNVSEPLSLK